VGAPLRRREVDDAAFEDDGYFRLRGCHCVIEGLARLVGFPTLLQCQKLFQRLDRSASRHGAVKHVHRRDGVRD